MVEEDPAKLNRGVWFVVGGAGTIAEEFEPVKLNNGVLLILVADVVGTEGKDVEEIAPVNENGLATGVLVELVTTEGNETAAEFEPVNENDALFVAAVLGTSVFEGMNENEETWFVSPEDEGTTSTVLAVDC